MADFEPTVGGTSLACDVPPVFRVRLSCSDPGDAEALLVFLRSDGVFAYPAGGEIEAVAVDRPGLDAPREMIGRVVDWLARTDAALDVRLI